MADDRMRAQPGQYLTFDLQSETYGIPIATVREINQMQDITPVPKTQEFVAGVLNLRGKVVPVIELRLKFSMTAKEYDKETCIIVIDTEAGQVGVIVDAVAEVVELNIENIEPSPQISGDHDSDFLTGMGKKDDKVMILVDVVKALSKDELHKYAQIAESKEAKVEKAA